MKINADVTNTSCCHQCGSWHPLSLVVRPHGWITFCFLAPRLVSVFGFLLTAAAPPQENRVTAPAQNLLLFPAISFTPTCPSVCGCAERMVMFAGKISVCAHGSSLWNNAGFSSVLLVCVSVVKPNSSVNVLKRSFSWNQSVGISSGTTYWWKCSIRMCTSIFHRPFK